MLHAKFHSNWSNGSGGVLPYGHGGHLGHVTWIIYINIGSPFLEILHIKFGFYLPNLFREDV